jgi:hypothetical protein
VLYLWVCTCMYENKQRPRSSDPVNLARFYVRSCLLLMLCSLPIFSVFFPSLHSVLSSSTSRRFLLFCWVSLPALKTTNQHIQFFYYYLTWPDSVFPILVYFNVYIHCTYGVCRIYMDNIQCYKNMLGYEMVYRSSCELIRNYTR